jgi:hypothetical protein
MEGAGLFCYENDQVVTCGGRLIGRFAVADIRAGHNGMEIALGDTGKTGDQAIAGE